MTIWRPRPAWSGSGPVSITILSKKKHHLEASAGLGRIGASFYYNLIQRQPFRSLGRPEAFLLQFNQLLPQVGLKIAQEGPRKPKMAPRWPKMVPRWPKMASRRPQDGLQVAQAGPKMTPRWAKLGPSWPQDGSSGFQ